LTEQENALTSNRSDNHPSEPTRPATARIDLNSSEHLQNLPNDTRQVIICSSDPNISLSKMNPHKVGIAIDNICGTIKSVEHQRSGNLLITTSTLEQVYKLINTKFFAADKIPIQVTVAWGKQLSYCKLYAPEFQHDSLDYLLNILKPLGIVSVRKLFSDPKKGHVPLYAIFSQ
jgi:hypothetical protein